MVKALLLDTNVLIYALNGSNPSVVKLLSDAQSDSFAISAITWMEVMVGCPGDTKTRTRQFLDSFQVIETSREIAERAVELRQTMRLKLPDAIIYASALVSHRTLMTYNRRDFPEGTSGVWCPAE